FPFDARGARRRRHPFPTRRSSDLDEPAFLDTLGWGYAVTGQLEQGAAALARARELAASLGMAPAVQAEILYHLAETLARVGRTDEASDLAQEAVLLDPGLKPGRQLLERLWGPEGDRGRVAAGGGRARGNDRLRLELWPVSTTTRKNPRCPMTGG